MYSWHTTYVYADLDFAEYTNKYCEQIYMKCVDKIYIVNCYFLVKIFMYFINRINLGLTNSQTFT